jgi:hypothetical protein
MYQHFYSAIEVSEQACKLPIYNNVPVDNSLMLHHAGIIQNNPYQPSKQACSIEKQ